MVLILFFTNLVKCDWTDIGEFIGEFHAKGNMPR